MGDYFYGIKSTFFIFLVLLATGCAAHVHQAKCTSKALVAYDVARRAGFSNDQIQFRTGLTRFGENHVQVFVEEEPGEWVPWGVAVSEGKRFPAAFSERRILAGSGWPELEKGIKMYTVNEYFRTFYK